MQFSGLKCSKTDQKLHQFMQKDKRWKQAQVAVNIELRRISLDKDYSDTTTIPRSGWPSKKTGLFRGKRPVLMKELACKW
ncbi:hypothetical protein HNQ59_000444 [Chitinivorax tropicus]|uniref:Uncharacterized protein n=1 Tax=Chitinivorax tropicus TaxID=714531 RepID=A0A840MKE9_9PROT|nr:hypothetical protein [Chitinivorax tropicus]